jgi:hypothetical protein
VDQPRLLPYRTADDRFKLYRYCVEVLMPVLWLLRYGISEWWQVGGTHPLIYGCKANEEEFPPGNFFYRLSRSVAGAVTLTYRSLETGTANVRILFEPFHGSFCFSAHVDGDGNKSTWNTWDEVHKDVEKKTLNRFYSQKTLNEMRETQDPS